MEDDMGETAQKLAVKNYRRRLRDRGLARFEVLGLRDDRDLIRNVAKRLAKNDEAASRLRDSMSADAPGDESVGGIYAALRRSPMVGANLDLRRPRVSVRKIKL
jgi:hypothetical protein